MPRASSSQRGYDKAHKQLKARLQPTIDAGLGICCELVCLYPSRAIPAGTKKWDLAHDRRQPGTYLGPAHTKCNRSEGATYGNRLRGKPKRYIAF